jgi:GDP-L-fucose synthase
MEARDKGDASYHIWGDGSASREFLYVDDAAKAIVDALELEEYSMRKQPFNLGTGLETNINELVEMICDIIDYKPEIIHDLSYPNGQQRRYYDMSKFESVFGYVPSTSLREGLEKTVDWYLRNKDYVEQRWP